MENQRPPWFVVILSTFAFLLFFILFIAVSEKYTKLVIVNNQLNGKVKVQHNELTLKNNINKTDSMLILCLAMINVESNFNTNAFREDSDAAGVLQITPIYIKEVNKYSGYQYKVEDRFNLNKSIEMFFKFNNKHNPTYNLERAIYLHNPRADSTYKQLILKQFNTIYSVLNIHNK